MHIFIYIYILISGKLGQYQMTQGLYRNQYKMFLMLKYILETIDQDLTLLNWICFMADCPCFLMIFQVTSSQISSSASRARCMQSNRFFLSKIQFVSVNVIRRKSYEHSRPNEIQLCHTEIVDQHSYGGASPQREVIHAVQRMVAQNWMRTHE